jgi:hypothetical protein
VYAIFEDSCTKMTVFRNVCMHVRAVTCLQRIVAVANANIHVCACLLSSAHVGKCLGLSIIQRLVGYT